MTKSLIGALLVAAAMSTACSDEAASPTGPTAQTPAPAASNSGSPTTGAPAGCTAPARPNNLRVTSAQGTQVELTWDAVPTATSYTLLVGAIPGNAEILNENTSQPSFRFTARDGQQFARVQAHSACGAGPASAYLGFTVRP